MPRIARRVDCGLVEVIATFTPTRALVSVDLPTLGPPTRATKPERCTDRRLPSPAVAAGARPGSSLVVMDLLLVAGGGIVLGRGRSGHDKGGQALAAPRGLLRVPAQAVDGAVRSG